MDQVVIEELGQTHPLAWHIGDFLTDLANVGTSGHTLRAYRGDWPSSPRTTTGRSGTWTPRRSGPTWPSSLAWCRRRASASARRWPRSAAWLLI
jgi:hypothetical protein